MGDPSAEDAPRVAVIGGGPAGLMAAEVAGAAGVRVTVYERMPTVGRKLLLAGRGGLNLTHSEPLGTLLSRYGAAGEALAPPIEAFPPEALVAWARGLGQPTFVGSSGRVFPRAMKASPLLRAWLARLAAQGVAIRTRREWLGWTGEGALLFADSAGGREQARPGATVLALGGASWPKLGSDGRWAEILRGRGVALSPFRPANCGFQVAWSEPFRARFAGEPLKTVALSFRGRSVRGEAVITAAGIEGGAVYAVSAVLRDALAEGGEVILAVDLRPDLTLSQIARRLDSAPRGASLATRLRKALSLPPVAVNLVRETQDAPAADAAGLAAQVKACPVRLLAPAPIERAISTAGGVRFDAVDEALTLRAAPGVFVAGEMLDWEAPTGGYLLQAAFATGAAAGRAALRSLGRDQAASAAGDAGLEPASFSTAR